MRIFMGMGDPSPDLLIASGFAPPGNLLIDLLTPIYAFISRVA